MSVEVNWAVDFVGGVLRTPSGPADTSRTSWRPSVRQARILKDDRLAPAVKNRGVAVLAVVLEKTGGGVHRIECSVDRDQVRPAPTEAVDRIEGDRDALRVRMRVHEKVAQLRSVHPQRRDGRNRRVALGELPAAVLPVRGDHFPQSREALPGYGIARIGHVVTGKRNCDGAYHGEDSQHHQQLSERQSAPWGRLPTCHSSGRLAICPTNRAHRPAFRTRN